MSGRYDIVVWVLLFAASTTDLLFGKIFNLMSLPLLGGGILFRFLSEGGASGLQALGAVVVAFVFFFPLYFLKTLAAADVKLLMAVGAWSDTRVVIQIGLIAILIGAIVGGFLLVKQEGWKRSLQSIGQHLRAPNEKLLKSHRMPFAPAFLCAFLVLNVAEKYQWSLF